MKIGKEQIEKALASLEAILETETTDEVSKASEQDLDQPEGADMGNPAKEKMSDAAKAAKAKKAYKSEDADADDKEEMEDEEPEMEKKMKARKSFAEEMPEEIQTKIDVSEFLKSLVDHTGECIDGLRAYVAKSDMNHEARYAELNGAVEGLQKSQAKIGIVLKAICEKIGVLEVAPAHAPKAETVLKSEAKPAEKVFKSGLEAEKGEEKVFKSLSDNPAIAKSQISNAICELVKKGEAADLDVIGFETNNYLRPEIAAKLKTVL